MNRILSISVYPAFALILAVSPLSAANQVTVADDDANQGMYSGGWNDGSGNDNGFFAWKMVEKVEPERSYAGHYLSNLTEHPSTEIVTTDRAFALFANGRGYEESVAFRGFAAPLQSGDNFTFDMMSGSFDPRWDEDSDTPGEVGVAYRTGNASLTVGDVEMGARMRFFVREGTPNYLISDSENEFDTGIPVEWGAVSVTLTLVDADTYDLEVINLHDKTMKKSLERRKFGGQSGAPIESLALFNRNSERNDFVFNNFRLSRNAP